MKSQNLCFLKLIIIILFCLVISNQSQLNSNTTTSYSSDAIPASFETCRCVKDSSRNSLIWPPAKPEDRLCSDGSYDLTLCIQCVNRNNCTLETMLQRRLNQLKMLKAENLAEGSTLKQWYHMEDPSNRSQYHMYPLSLNISKIISNIKQGLPVDQAPINNLRINLLNVSQSVCGPASKKKYDLIVVWKSAIYNFEDRQMIREQYKNLENQTSLRIGMVFSVAMPRIEGGNNFNMDGFNITLPARAGLALIKWKGRHSEALDMLYKEAAQYDDIILADFVDTYINLTYKLVAGYRWATTFCQDRNTTFLFLDDDFRFNPKLLEAYFKSMSPQERANLLSGSIQASGTVLRPRPNPALNKWAITEDEVPWPIQPPFIKGFATFIGSNVLSDLSIATAYTKFLRMDDVFLGFVMQKLPYKMHEAKNIHMNSTAPEKALIYPVA